jgi:spermidine synthase
MPERQSSFPAVCPASPRFLPVLLLLFVGSGCSALVYEIVWFQMLQLVIGSSAVSMGVLLGTFMGGMCLGSLALSRVVSRQRHPLRVYALLELGTGILAIAVLRGIPLVNDLYTANVGHGMPGIFLRAVVCAICLLPPTLLMGATLPAIARWIEATPSGVSWLGFFYGGNIAGAVFGCLLAGFYLLRVFDMATATYVAASINVAVAVAGLTLAFLTPHRVHGANPASAANAVSDASHAPGDAAAAPGNAKPAPWTWVVYVAIGLSGLTALGAEVIWTRLLSLMLGGTVYTFSLILAVFLLGLGIGSSVGSFLARTAERPRLMLGGCQFLLSAAVAWTAWMLTQSLPYWPIEPSLSNGAWFSFQLDLARCFWAVLPPALLWGASFPLALASVASRGQDPGRMVGGVYAANTVGAILGAVLFSVCLIGAVGTRDCQRVLIALSAVSGLLVLAPHVWLLRPWAIASGQSHPDVAWSEFSLAGAACLAALAVAVLLGWSVPAIPGGLVAYGRTLPRHVNEARDSIDDWDDPVQFVESKIVYVGEGMNSSVAVSEILDGNFNVSSRSFHVSGKVEASSLPQDMRLQRMLGHLPALMHAKPRSVLIVGCGAGVTAGSFTQYPDINRIVICEIEPLIPTLAATYFGEQNYNVVKDPRVEVVYDDARHFILTTDEKFDIITSDPIHPWVKGSATLYTKEYFELCKKRLNPGGIVTQWVPLYESSTATVKSEIASFFEAFANGTIWSNDTEGKGYDVVLLGSTDPMTIDVDKMEQRLNGSDHLAARQSLSDVSFSSAQDLLATYAGQASDLKPWLEGAELNCDSNLRLQYLAGTGLNSYENDTIYDDMLRYRRFPSGLFTGSGRSNASLWLAIERSQKDAAKTP